MTMVAETTIQITTEGALRLLPGVDPQSVRLWETSPDGKRRPGAAQATDANGLPLWDLRVLATTVVYDRAEPSFITLRIASATPPDTDDLAMLPLLIGGAELTAAQSLHALYQALGAYQDALYARGLRALSASPVPQYRRVEFFEALDAVIAARSAFAEHSHKLEQVLGKLEQRHRDDC